MRTLHSAILFISAVSIDANAQSTPSEFAELSLQALLNMDVSAKGDYTNKASRWNFAVQLKAVEFEGYLDGNQKLSFDEVLFDPQTETRTTKNFPVLPTVINQYVSVVRVGYQMRPELQIAISVPFIRQATDHISSVPNYLDFLIDSSGLGDTVLSGSYRFSHVNNGFWWVVAGISLPTGSIDEIGDTPRAPGDQQLPYTMQLGSGTFDFPIEISFQSNNSHDYSISFSAMLRTGKNKRNYRLGNNYELKGKYRFALNRRAKLFVGSEYSYLRRISGQDDEITVAGDFPYPVAITNPALYGGRKVSISVGAVWEFSDTMNVTLDFSKPVYEHLNGPQPKELWRTGLQITKRL